MVLITIRRSGDTEEASLRLYRALLLLFHTIKLSASVFIYLPSREVHLILAANILSFNCKA